MEVTVQFDGDPRRAAEYVHLGRSGAEPEVESAVQLEPPGRFGQRFQEREQKSFGGAAGAVVFRLGRRWGSGGSNRGDGRFEEGRISPVGGDRRYRAPRRPGFG